MDETTAHARKPSAANHRANARNAAFLNQFATPGLGSLMAGRRLAGAGQLMLAVAGFTMVIVWFVQVVVRAYHEILGGPVSAPHYWLGVGGVAVFIASWFWALGTSLKLMREARRKPSEEL